LPLPVYLMCPRPKGWRRCVTVFTVRARIVYFFSYLKVLNPLERSCTAETLAGGVAAAVSTVYNSIQFLYLSAFQQVVACNRRALNLYITKLD
jgi:hypothetical protein